MLKCMSALWGCLMTSEAKDFRFLGTRVTDSSEWPWGYRELNPAPLEEHSMFLTTESHLQPPKVPARSSFVPDAVLTQLGKCPTNSSTLEWGHHRHLHFRVAFSSGNLTRLFYYQVLWGTDMSQHLSQPRNLNNHHFLELSYLLNGFFLLLKVERGCFVVFLHFPQD